MTERFAMANEAPRVPQPGSMSWRVQTTEDPPRVVAAFHGWLSTEEGIRSAHAFRETIATTRRQVVWDVRAMTGYDTGARLAWQEVLWPVRKNIVRLEVEGAKGIVRLGAISLAIVLGIPWRMS